jgi:hypothetical protein
MAIKREEFDWGVRLSTSPFGGDNEVLVIKAEIDVRKPGKGSEVRIAFTGTTMASPLRLLDAQTWNEALTAIIAETRKTVADLKTAPSKKKR